MNPIPNPPPLQIAHWCLQKAIIPLPVAGKLPTISDWPNFRPTKDALPDYFNGSQQNIGALLGPASQHLVDVDLDWPECELLADAFLPSSWRFGRRDDAGQFHLRHVMLRCKDITSQDWKAPAIVFSKPLSIVQVLSAGRHVVLPGSIHEDTGQEIVWQAKPAADALAEIPADQLLQVVNRLAGTAMLVRLWPDLEGSRHEVALALAGACYHAGWTFDETAAMATALLTAAHDPEKRDRIKAIQDTLQRAAGGQPVTGFPKLADLLPGDVAMCLRKWWQLSDDALQLTFNGQPIGSTPNAAKDSWGQETLAVHVGSTIKPNPIVWLWQNWLAQGKLHIVAGPPGTGKTSTALSMAATVTQGSTWPDGKKAKASHVLIWSGEDDIEDTLTPRLLACGADMSKVHFVDKVRSGQAVRAFDPARDTQLLHDYAAKIDPPPALLMVDPIVSAVAGDSHKNAEVRRALQPLVDLAEDLDCAVLGVTHFSKGGAGRDPVERVTGSLAFGALARVVMAAAKLPEEEGGGRVLVRAKSNIGPDSGGFMYDLLPIELPGHPGVHTTLVAWGIAMEGSARELLAKADITPTDPDEHSALAEAKEFLRQELTDGPLPAKQLLKDAADLGHTKRTIERAKSALGITSSKEGFQGVWHWSLPLNIPKERQETQRKP